jgi:hypothetical protein
MVTRPIYQFGIRQARMRDGGQQTGKDAWRWCAAAHGRLRQPLGLGDTGAECAGVSADRLLLV